MNNEQRQVQQLLICSAECRKRGARMYHKVLRKMFINLQ